MPKDKFQEELREIGEAMMKDFALNAYITGTLEGKTLLDLDVEKMMAELRTEWDRTMSEMPRLIQRLQDGETLAAKYRFAGKDRLWVGLNKKGPFMRIEPSFTIAYSPELFANSATVEALVDNHQRFYSISREMLGMAFEDIQNRTELEDEAKKFREFMARTKKDGLVYRMKKGATFALGNVFAYLLFKKSYGQVMVDAAMNYREQIRGHDALSRFFAGENHYVAETMSTGRNTSNETGIREIGDLAQKLAHCHGRLRQEKVGKLRAYLSYVPAQY